MARAAAVAASSARASSGRTQSAAAGFGLPARALRLVQEALWIGLAALAAFLLLILLSYDKADPGWSHAVVARTISNAGGRVGAWFADLLLYLFGLSAYLLVVLLGASVLRGLRTLRASAPDAVAAQRIAWERWIGFGLLLLGCVGMESARLHSLQADLPMGPGGMVGAVITDPLFVALGPVGGTLVLLVLVAAGFSLWSGWSWLTIFERIGFALEWAGERLVQAVVARRDRRIGEVAATERDEQVQVKRRILDDDPEPVRIETPVARIERSERAEAERQSVLFVDLPADTQLPPVSLLDEPPVAAEGVSQETLEYTSRLIEKKLSDFNVAAHVVAAYPGPVITRYEIEPATGVKGSQIVNLSKDLARALSLVSIRVVETIPGKNLMGLELPNARRQTVRLSEILASQVYATSASPLTLALGKDIAGNPMVVDLAKMPHLLVAGTTGSGKSVGINAMLLSLLYKSDPTQVRMILIDPKMLEMSTYEGIPHLLAPVVTDMRQAGNALNWCVAEMERRYRLMSRLGVRNLSGYNHKIAEAEKREQLIPNPFSLTPDAPEPLGRLPQIVVVIDELADLMMVVGKKIEELIARLAQKARAAGIHLILATQRPSVDVITGLIKANIPTRVAFQVSSKIDSRTILDQMGAESLLGQGDMLYLPPGGGVPMRVHGAFVADGEVHKVVEHWRQLAEPQYVEGILEGGVPEEVDPGSAVGFGGLSQTLAEAGVDGEADPMYDQAVAVVMRHKRASISLVQRHLRIGYNRAARLLEQMEKSGLVSAMASNGNRELLVPSSQDA
ncbi:MAG: DNA translocase FtsK [Lautropia sp.]|nr:MAG: DNA translocase FtsK [Pseudomonadota bacterium]MBC6960078.1 DNA translocase FtsK [Lautropia sp.]MCL4702336.1 DNA translocase FtsK 4TM domain-containing protein [Burkholderiaceae bacterium]MDL1907595.1 DNA translocase FtsK [Betaproteobacteria bacterium PRO1]